MAAGSNLPILHDYCMLNIHKLAKKVYKQVQIILTEFWKMTHIGANETVNV